MNALRRKVDDQRAELQRLQASRANTVASTDGGKRKGAASAGGRDKKARTATPAATEEEEDGEDGEEERHVRKKKFYAASLEFQGSFMRSEHGGKCGVCGDVTCRFYRLCGVPGTGYPYKKKVDLQYKTLAQIKQLSKEWRAEP